jgi:ribosomal-protein-serine acetyltransferase
MKKMFPVTLKTDRHGVILRRFEKRDARALFGLIDCNRKHLSQFGDVTATKYPNYASVLESIMHPKNRNRFRYGIWYDDHLVGTVNITVQGKQHAEVGYWIGEQYCRKGYALTATQTLVKHALTATPIREVVAVVHQLNAASLSVILRAGFHYSLKMTMHAKRPEYAWYVRKA